MRNAAIFASGEGTNAENLIVHFKNDPRIKIKLIITNKDTAGVIARAEKHNKTVQIISKEALNNYTDQIIEFLKTEKIDLIILAGFTLKLPEKLVQAFPDKIINIHPSLLPKYGGKGMYGMNVHKAVVDSKELQSGITIHYVNENYDEGKIIAQYLCDIDPADSPEMVAEKIHQLEYSYYPKAIEKLLS